MHLRLDSVCLLLGVLLFQFRVHAVESFSPFWSWKTLEGPHFIVNYPERLEKTAPTILRYLEEAHETLSPILRWTPRQKTSVTIVDNRDDTNGFVIAQERYGMVLYLTPPRSYSTLYHYDDWLRFLTIHEYTHQLNIDPTEGFWEPIRWFFGDSIRPNVFMPGWMHEGLATYMETRFTKAGRGRSPMYEAYWRAALAEGTYNTSRFMTLEKLSGSTPYFPGGQNEYFFGFSLMNQVALDEDNLKRTKTNDEEEALKSVDDIHGVASIRSGHRVPFFINGNLENVSGKSWISYWNDLLIDTKVRMKTEISQIRSKSTTDWDYLTSVSLEPQAFALSPDKKWIAYSDRSLDDDASLHLRSRGSDNVDRVLTDADSTGGLSFTPDSKTLFFSTLRVHDDYYKFMDLAAYRIDEDEEYFLTRGKRAFDPDVSPDGKQITYCLTRGLRTLIAVADLKEKEGKFHLENEKVLFNPPEYGKASTPKFSVDSSKIIFSYHSPNKASEEIVEVDRSGGKARSIVDNGKFNRFPSVDRRSGNIYFVSDKSGVDNLYVYQKDQASVQVSNVLTALWFSQVDHDRNESLIYGSVLTSEGWRLARSKGRPSPVEMAAVQVASPPVPQPDGKVNQLSEEALSQNSQKDDYLSWSSMLPRRWGFFGSYDSSYGLNLGARLSGYDSLEIQAYNLAASYYTKLDTFESYAQYSNRMLALTWAVGFEYQVDRILYDDLDQLYFDKELSLFSSLSYPFKFTHSILIPTLKFSVDRRFRFFEQDQSRAIARTSYIPTYSASINYSNSRSSPLAIFPESGRDFFFGIKSYLPQDQTSYKLMIKDSEYIKVFDHLTITPSVVGQWSTRLSSYSSAKAIVSGTSSGITSDDPSFPTHGFDRMNIRGYPNSVFSAKAAGVGSLDLRFPLWRMLSGVSTLPVYFDNLVPFVFGDFGYFPDKEPGEALISAVGGGINLGVQLFYQLDLTFSLQYHAGLNEVSGGDSELLFTIAGLATSF